MSFCRITGRARSLPKPNFFPIIPPVSPGDARRLCRITGRRMDRHNYVPLLEFGKRPECCMKGTSKPHCFRQDLKYVTPILKKESLTHPGDVRAFEDLQKVLKVLKKKSPGDKMFVYQCSSSLTGLILPVEVEEAIKLGEIENISVSKNCDKVMFKIRGKPTLFVNLKEVDMNTADNSHIHNGGGQSKETLSKQKKILEEKKKRKNNLAGKKIFEDLEKKADDEVDKMEMKPPKGKTIFGAGKSKKAKQYREKLNDFIEMYNFEKNMAIYGPQWKSIIFNKCQNYDWEVIDKIKASELDSASAPNQIKINAVSLSKNKTCNRRIKNVYIPDQSGLDIVPAIEDVSIMNTDLIVSHVLPLIASSKRENALFNLRGRGSLKTMFANEESLKILPNLNDIKLPFEASLLRPGVIYDHGDGLKYSESASTAPDGANVIVGAIFPENYFLPGEFLEDGSFIPGQRMNSVNGEFIPGASVRKNDGTFSFIPGLFHFEDAGGKQTTFTAGQFINTSENVDSASFIKGQVVHTSREAKFVEGETVLTADGTKFVAGISVDGTFVSGTMIDSGEESSKFVTGQMTKMGSNPLEFIAGAMGEINDKPAFIPGQNLASGFLPGQIVKSDSLTFIPGEVVINHTKNIPQFIPGINSPENEDFLPGLMDSSSLLLEGKMIQINGQTHFVPGKTVKGKFAKARRDSKLSEMDVGYHEDPLIIDGETLSVIHRKVKPRNGYFVRSKGNCSIDDFKFVESIRNPDEWDEVICGRMECGEEGPKFVPGKIMEINGTKTFIPGKVLEDGIFVPGKMIETKNGPKFIPGQVIDIDGGEKFIPGQIMIDKKDGIPKFVPGQIIDTKSGPSFIPGQVIRTDNGLKFVPGQIVETDNGAFFVPGQVMDSPSGAQFLPGQIIETEEGLRLLPPDLFGNLEFLVQGFDINSEEARLLLGRGCSSDDLSNLLGGIGGATVSGEALQALAEGFQPRFGNVISKVGDGLEVDKVLSDELLEKYDDPDIRRLLKTIFLSVFLDTASKANLVYHVLEDYVSQELESDLDGTIMNPKLKLNPAIEKLIQTFSEKKNSCNMDSEEANVCSLMAGLITCSIPGALRESSESHIDFDETRFKETVFAYIEESIQGILEEEGYPSFGMERDIKKLVDAAKGLSVDENKNFFARVTALTEGRCNEQFMENLIRTLSSTSLSNAWSKVDLQELFSTLVAILSPRQDLQNGFKLMYKTDPEFIQDVLISLREGNEKKDISTLDKLHSAISRSITRNCQSKLDDVMHKVELGDLEYVISMLEQALGLAKYLGKRDIAHTIMELLSDPIRLEVIKDDPVVKDVLQKILIMREMACTDDRKKKKLLKLQKQALNGSIETDDTDDDSLKDFVKQSSALIKPPPRRGSLDSNNKLQRCKSKSMIQKSKSTIMSAKDISMNAFMAMKSNDKEDQTSWLHNFLSESIVEEVPWECSKALVMLKEGYQAIIPREASRKILLGEASYTLIDDKGIEFFLSPEDQRERNGKVDDPREIYLSSKSSSLWDSKKEKSSTKHVDFQMTMANTNGDSSNGQSSLAKEDSPPTASTKDTEENEDLFNSLSIQPKDEDDSSSSEPKVVKRKSHFLASSQRDSEDRESGGDFSLVDTNLEKYRPHNYDIGPRKGSENDDINDIMDYYCNLGSRARAMRRLNHYPSFGEDHERSIEPADPYLNGGRKHSAPLLGHYGASQEVENGFTSLRRPKKMNSSMYDAEEPLREPSFQGREQEDFDESSRLLIDKARSVRNNPVWSEPIGSKYDWNSDSFYEPVGGPQRGESSRPLNAEEGEDGESTLNSKTRDLLNKLRKSTAELEDINSDEYKRPTRFSREPDDRESVSRKPSRFLRQPAYEDYEDRGPPPPPLNRREKDFSTYRGGPRYDPEPYNDRYENSSFYSGEPRSNSRGGGDYRRNYDRSQSFIEPSSRGRREPSSHRYNRYSDYMDEEPPPRSNGRYGNGGFERRRPPSKYQADDDDIDAMISDLKRKTTGRDMRAVASRIEGRAVTPPSSYNYGRYDDRDYEDEGRYGNNDYYY